MFVCLGWKVADVLLELLEYVKPQRAPRYKIDANPKSLKEVEQLC